MKLETNIRSHQMSRTWNMVIQVPGKLVLQSRLDKSEINISSHRCLVFEPDKERIWLQDFEAIKVCDQDGVWQQIFSVLSPGREQQKIVDFLPLADGYFLVIIDDEDFSLLICHLMYQADLSKKKEIVLPFLADSYIILTIVEKDGKICFRVIFPEYCSEKYWEPDLSNQINIPVRKNLTKYVLKR